MKIFKSTKQIQKHMLGLKKQNKSIGFVPTMGSFHDGHTSLMEVARQENDVVVVSIFVNPLQFGPTEDFGDYPRNIEEDIEIAKRFDVDILFVPSISSMYPRPMSSIIEVVNKNDVMCGISRPTHFNGVAVVLTKLFNLILPDRAYFGMKDAQQLAIVKDLVEDYNFPIEVVGLPTVREENGLAKSSRNAYLDESKKDQAKVIYEAFLMIQEIIKKGERNIAIIKATLANYINQHSYATIDYIELLSYPDLEQIVSIDSLTIIAVAIKIGETRLIDNIIVDRKGDIVKALR